VLLAIVVVQVTLRFYFDQTARTLEITFFSVRIPHVLHVITARSKTFVAVNAHETLFLVFIDVVHTHCRCLSPMTVKTAFRTINMSTHLLICLSRLCIARARLFSLNGRHFEKNCEKYAKPYPRTSFRENEETRAFFFLTG